VLTVFLSRGDVSRHLQALHLLRELRAALTTHTLDAAGPLWTAAVKPGVELGGSAAGSTLAQVRATAWRPVPAWCVQTTHAGRSVLHLHEGESGRVLAVMDAAQLAALRASLTAALAVDVLARADAKNVAVLGTGAAVSSAIKALRLVRTLERVWFHEPNLADNFELARRLGTTLSMAISAADTVREAVRDADLVILTGGVSLGDAPLRPGAHVTVLNAEQFREAPLSKQTLERARRFTDAAQPTQTWGLPFELELRNALDGSAPARERADQLTVFVSVSPPQLDLLTAWHVFEGARHDDTLTRIDLEA
jgi:ornithine cyclodeaminase/alanine dehydrogenase-like protein (mu-crystallin family)